MNNCELSDPPMRRIFLYHRGVAQLVEHWSPKPTVPRSNRGAPAKLEFYVII